MTAIIIKKSKTAEIRIEPKEYNGTHYMDVREYKIWGDEPEPRATKSGVTIPPEFVDALIAGLEKQKAGLAKTVVAVEGKRDAFVIAKTPEDAMLLKKAKLYDSEDDATGKAPPDGFRLFKVLIEDGVVVKKRLLYRRRNNRWQAVESTAKPETATAAKPSKVKHR